MNPDHDIKLDRAKILEHNRVLNINTERLETYLDFIQTIFIIVIETYPGDDVMLSDYNYIKEHFVYCWNKTIDIFEQEGLSFDRSNEIIFDILFDDIQKRFYHSDTVKDGKDAQNILHRTLKLYELMFNPIKERTNKDYTNFYKLYILFEQCLHIKR